MHQPRNFQFIEGLSLVLLQIIFLYASASRVLNIHWILQALAKFCDV